MRKRNIINNRYYEINEYYSYIFNKYFFMHENIFGKKLIKIEVFNDYFSSTHSCTHKCYSMAIFKI